MPTSEAAYHTLRWALRVWTVTAWGAVLVAGLRLLRQR